MINIMDKWIYLSPPHMSGSERKFINEAFEDNCISPVGANVDGFEKELGEYYELDHVVSLSSGTSALHIAMVLLGVKTGDEVIASTFTFSATVNPIVYQGATPVLIDSEKETWNMSPLLLEMAINDRIAKGKKPKALTLVHVYGMPAKMDEIMALANRHGIPVVEDAAEAVGSKYHDKKLGTFGTLGILSFNGNKIITTSAGGALISNNEGLIQRAKFLSTQSREDTPHYQHSEIGYNYRMSNILAGIGRGQLEVLENRIMRRRANHDFYYSKLHHIDGISFLTEPPGCYSNYWLTTIIVDPQKTGGKNREDIRLGLRKEYIESRPLWKPMHMQPVFAHSPAYIAGTSEALFRDGLCLPSGSNLREDQRQRIVETIVDVLKK
jgi:dTDP-4-amino-4,6-dideoxygalactose transaminase